jgi:hypothetical protein
MLGDGRHPLLAVGCGGRLLWNRPPQHPDRYLTIAVVAVAMVAVAMVVVVVSVAVTVLVVVFIVTLAPVVLALPTEPTHRCFLSLESGTPYSSHSDIDSVAAEVTAKFPHSPAWTSKR